MEDINLYQYLAVIPPSRMVNSDVTNMKDWFMTTKGWNAPNHSKPHFTVCRFIQPLSNEARISKKLRELSETVKPFVISLSDFGSFQNKTSTIYLRVENEEQFSRIPQYLQIHLRPMLTLVKGYSPNFIRKGHLTIARQIPENEFNRVWPYWKNMRYHAESDANRIVFLRKRLSTTRGTARPDVNRYEVVGDYPFLGKGISDAQLKLF